MKVMKSTCISKYRDLKDRIISYEIRDENGFVSIFSSNQLKDLINKGQLIVDNLQIDKAGRLVDKKVETGNLEMKKLVDLLICMEQDLIKGKAIVIPKLNTDKRFTSDELNKFIPKYLIKSMLGVLENLPTGTAIRDVCETIVPMVVNNVKSKGYKVNKYVIAYDGVEVEIYELAK